MVRAPRRPSPLPAVAAGAATAACAAALWLRWLVSGPDGLEALWALSFLSYAVLGALVVRRRHGSPIGWLLLAAGLVVQVAALVDAYALWADEVGWPATWARWAQGLLWLPALSIVLVQLPLRFPTGDPPGPRWRWVGHAAWVVVGVATVATAFAPGPMGEDLPRNNPLGIDGLGWALTPLAGAGALLLPLALVAFGSLATRRHGTARQHLQLRWFCSSVVLAIAIAVTSAVLAPGQGVGEQVGPAAAAVAVALPAVGIAIAVGRHRLYGIDALISRSVAYGILTAGAAAVALALVAITSALLGPETTTGSVLTAVGVAAVVHASWQGVQQRVDLAVYGVRGDPYRVVRTLGERLELAGSADEALDVAAATLAGALRLPWVAIRLVGTSAADVSVGRLEGPVEVVPVLAHGARVADLEVGVRRGESALGERDREVVGELARSVAPLCRATALSAELRASIERLSRARDEERERVHRDLHDGVGPTLAGLALRVSILRASGPARGDRDLADLEAALKEAFSEVTDLIDGLRPRLLDDLGLARGLAKHCEALASTVTPPLSIDLTTTGRLDGLAPPVERAAWYIASEALSNVVRHSGAERCEVRVAGDDGELAISVTDDGCGFDPGFADATGRTGLRSMRDRARSLGGACTVEADGSTGTRVTAVLPLVAP